MSENPVEVKVVEEPKKGKMQKVKDFFGIGKTQATVKESDRFQRLGYLQYPMEQKLDFRIINLRKTLTVITDNYGLLYERRRTLLDKLAMAENKEQIHQIQAQLDVLKNQFRDLQTLSIQQLSHAQELTSAPWCRGLDKPRMAKKIREFQKVLSLYGEIPNVYPVLRYGTHLLINQSWSSEDVGSQAPLMFETRTTVQGKGGFAESRTDDLGIRSMNRELQRQKEEIARLKQEKPE